MYGHDGSNYAFKPIHFLIVDYYHNLCIINTIMKKDNTPKTRFHKMLFTNDSPYGHKIQKDKTKTIPRKQKHKRDLSDK